MSDLTRTLGTGGGASSSDIFARAALVTGEIHGEKKKEADKLLTKMQDDKKVSTKFANAEANIVTNDKGEATITKGSDAHKTLQVLADQKDPMAIKLLAKVNAGTALNPTEVGSLKTVFQNAKTASGIEDDQISLIKLQGLLDEIKRTLEAMTGIVKGKGDTDEKVTRNL